MDSIFDKVVQVHDLTTAAAYFLDRVNDVELKNISNIQRCKTLESKIEVLDKKYFDRDYQATDKDNDRGILIQQQEESVRKYYPPKIDIAMNKNIVVKNKKVKVEFKPSPRKTCIVLSKEIDSNSLGIEDYYYYYILYRKKTLTSWSSLLNMSKKYCRVSGFYLPFSVLKHIDNNMAKETSDIIFVLADPEKGIQPQIYSSKSSDIFKYFIKNKMPVMINRWGEMVTGIPLEELKPIVT